MIQELKTARAVSVMNPHLARAIAALAADGYDTYERGDASVYIADLAPAADADEYGHDTAPGSPWAEECAARLAVIARIVEPCGCSACWADDDVVISANDMDDTN